MPRRLLFIASVLMMLMSCSKEPKNVSRAEFTENILPDVDVQNLTVKDGMHKVLYAMISIFFPFFGPIIYLNAKKGSR